MPSPVSPHGKSHRRLILGCLLAAPSLAADGRAEPPDLEELNACADRAWYTDVEGWADFSFDRLVVLTDLDRNGDVRSRKERRFRMTPMSRGFDERLLSEDGRPATEDEIRDFRRRQNFTRTYRGAAQLQFDNPLGEDLVLIPVLRNQDFRYLGEEVIDGVACHRRVFDARPAPERGSTNQQLMHAVRGSTCVAVDGCHLVSLDMETIRPIKQSLTTIDYLRVTIRGQPVESGWVPARIEARFDFNVLGRHLRRISTYTYSRFRRVK